MRITRLCPSSGASCEGPLGCPPDVLDCFAYGLFDLFFRNFAVSLPTLAEKGENLFPPLGELFDQSGRHDSHNRISFHFQDVFPFFDVELF
jgi:hypothetical protein